MWPRGTGIDMVMDNWVCSLKVRVKSGLEVWLWQSLPYLGLLVVYGRLQPKLA